MIIIFSFVSSFLNLRQTLLIKQQDQARDCLAMNKDMKKKLVLFFFLLG